MLGILVISIHYIRIIVLWRGMACLCLFIASLWIALQHIKQKQY